MLKFCLTLGKSMLFLLCTPLLAFGHGFALYNQGAKASGIGGAFTGQADDPTAIFYNPAGIVQLDGTQASVGFTAYFPDATFRSNGTSGIHGTFEGQKTDLDSGNQLTPYGYFTHKLTEHISFGVGAFSNFGLSSPYATEDPVAQAVAQLVNERPGLRVRVHVVDPDEVLDAVLGGDHEVGFGGREALPQHDQLALELLRPRRLLLACRPGHPLLRLRPSLAQVLSFPLVGTLLKGSTAAVVASGDAVGALDPARRGFSPAIEVNSFDAARRIARSSDALFPATPTMLAADLAIGQLATLDFDAPVLRFRPAWVQLRDRTLSPAARRLIDIVRPLEPELGDEVRDNDGASASLSEWDLAASA